MPDDPTAGNANVGTFQAYGSRPIYDNVIRAKEAIIKDSEHHVTQTREGTVEQTDGSEGPHYGGVALVFLTDEQQKAWVELPDCTGAAGEIKLSADVKNATVATCKQGPSQK